MSFISLEANYTGLKLKKCSSFCRDQGTETIRMQALQLWISDWIELSSKLWSESTLCCHVTARSVAVHTKHEQRTALYSDSLPHAFIIHFCLHLFFRGLQATVRIITSVCRSTLAKPFDTCSHVLLCVWKDLSAQIHIKMHVFLSFTCFNMYTKL